MKRLFYLITLPLVVMAAIIILRPPYLTPSLGDATGHTNAPAKALVVPAPAPNVVLSQLAGYTSPPVTSGMPILLYHGINNNVNDGYSITQYQFALEMALLYHLGYHAISIQQFAAWHAGQPVQLPSRPILITFDDSRSDSWLGADQVLAKYHMRATMFVIVGRVSPTPGHFYLSWSQLHQMQNSGRWDIQFHAYMGHVQELIGDTPGYHHPPALGYYYDGLRYYPQTHTTEIIAHYRGRVTHDIDTGLKVIHQHGFMTPTMAMPFGADGIDGTMHAILLRILRRHFIIIFVQNNSVFAHPGGFEVTRYETHSNTTLDQLYAFLSHGR